MINLNNTRRKDITKHTPEKLKVWSYIISKTQSYSAKSPSSIANNLSFRSSSCWSFSDQNGFFFTICFIGLLHSGYILVYSKNVWIKTILACSDQGMLYNVPLYNTVRFPANVLILTRIGPEQVNDGAHVYPKS